MPECETKNDCGNDADFVAELNETLYGVCSYCFLNGYTGEADATEKPLEVLSQ